MAKIKDWEYRGLYNDGDSRTVIVQTQPDKLPAYAKKALLEFDYDDRIWYLGGGESRDKFLSENRKTCNKLEEVGLAREVGNAWNKRIRFAPDLYEWIEKEQKKQKRQKNKGKQKQK